MKFERLDRRIKLRRLAPVIDPTSGEETMQPVEVLTVAAEFRSVIGSENFKAGREISSGFTSFVIRYVDGIDSQNWDIVDWLDRIWDIMGEPQTIGRREGLQLFSQLRQY